MSYSQEQLNCRSVPSQINSLVKININNKTKSFLILFHRKIYHPGPISLPSSTISKEDKNKDKDKDMAVSSVPVSLPSSTISKEDKNKDKDKDMAVSSVPVSLPSSTISKQDGEAAISFVVGANVEVSEFSDLSKVFADKVSRVHINLIEEEAAALRLRVAALEAEKDESLLLSHLATLAATKEAQKHKKEAEEYKRQLALNDEYSRRAADEKDSVRSVLAAELEIALSTLSKAGEGAVAAATLKEEFEKRTMLAIKTLEDKLVLEAVARSAAEERIRAIELEQEQCVLCDLSIHDDGSIMTPLRGKIELERVSHSPSVLVALATSPAALASLREFHRDLGALLDDGTGEKDDVVLTLSDSYGSSEADGHYDWSGSNPRATVVGNRKQILPGTAPAYGSKKPSDVLLAFEHIYPPSESRSPVRQPPPPKSLCTIDGNDFESSAPNPLYKKALSCSPVRPTAAAGRKSVKAVTGEEDEEELLLLDKSKFENVLKNLNAGEVSLAEQHTVGLPGRIVFDSSSKSKDSEMDEVTELEGTTEEMESTSVMHDLESVDDNSWVHLDDQEESIISSMAGIKLPNPRKRRGRSFIAGEHQLNLKLNRSLTAIYRSLEELRVRTRHAHLIPPEDHSSSLLYNTETGKMKEAWRRLTEHHMSKENMIALGSFPKIVHVVVKPNEAALWAIFRCYCPPDCKMPLCVSEVDLSGCSLRGDSKRRVLSLTSIWDLLRDFDVCPDLCTYVVLAFITNILSLHCH